MSTENTIRRRNDYAEALDQRTDQRPVVAPAVDIYENAEEVLLVADLPGVGNQDVNIRLEKGELSIEGQRRLGVEGAELATEFRFLDFRRAFTVPQGIQAEGIKAEMKHGVLKVHLPKVAALKPRQINVQNG